LPAEHGIGQLQGFVQTRADGSWRATVLERDELLAGGWNEIVLEIPESYEGEPLELGVLVRTIGAWSGVIHIDAVAFGEPPTRAD